MTVRGLARVLVVLAVLAGTTACGGAPRAHAPERSLDEVTTFSVLSPREIAAAAIKETKSVKAYHFGGFMRSDRRRVEIVGDVDAGHCRMRAGKRSAAMDVRRVRGAYYVRFGPNVLSLIPFSRPHGARPDDPRFRAFVGQWWEMPEAAENDLAEMCTVHRTRSLLGEVIKTLRTTELVRGSVGRVGGELAVELMPPQGIVHVWVAATGRHRVLRFAAGYEGEGTGDIDVRFSLFDRPVNVPVPPHRSLPVRPTTQV